MAKNNKQNNTKNVTAAANDNVKIVTKYDRKMQKRKEEENRNTLLLSRKMAV